MTPCSTDSDPTSSPPPSSGIEKLQTTEQALTYYQRTILTNLVEYQGYSTSLILKAFEKCDKDANEYDIQCWCGKNESYDESSDELSENDDESNHGWLSGSDFSDEEEDNSNAPPQQQQSPNGIIYICTPKIETLRVYAGYTL